MASELVYNRNYSWNDTERIVDYIRRRRHVIVVILPKRRKVSQSVNRRGPQHVSSSFDSENMDQPSLIAEAGRMRTLVPWNT